MGRHAAPGDGEPLAEQTAQLTDPVPPVTEADESSRPPGSRPQPIPRGRHAVPDENDDVDVEPAAGAYVATSTAVTDRIPASAGEGAERPLKRQRKEGATAADLHLLRSNPALRNRVIAAVLVPFVLFFVVLELLGRLDAFAVWIWLPLISAGLGAGLLLDTGHAKAKSTSRSQAE